MARLFKGTRVFVCADDGGERSFVRSACAVSEVRGRPDLRTGRGHEESSQGKGEGSKGGKSHARCVDGTNSESDADQSSTDTTSKGGIVMRLLSVGPSWISD